MFCTNSRLFSKHMVFCILQFLGSTASTVGLCMSVFDLAHNVYEPWAWQYFTVSGCIVATIILQAIKDSICANPKLFEGEYNLESVLDD